MSQHHKVAEVAVVGVKDNLKGQEILPFVIVKNLDHLKSEKDRKTLEKEIKITVGRKLGPVGRPARVLFVKSLPKTRSGKIMGRTILALAESRDPGDITTLEDPSSLDSIKEAVSILTKS